MPLSVSGGEACYREEFGELKNRRAVPLNPGLKVGRPHLPWVQALCHAIRCLDYVEASKARAVSFWSKSDNRGILYYAVPYCLHPMAGTDRLIFVNRDYEPLHPDGGSIHRGGDWWHHLRFPFLHVDPKDEAIQALVHEVRGLQECSLPGGTLLYNTGSLTEKSQVKALNRALKKAVAF